jgi:hypothetical protein
MSGTDAVTEIPLQFYSLHLIMMYGASVAQEIAGRVARTRRPRVYSQDLEMKIFSSCPGVAILNIS